VSTARILFDECIGQPTLDAVKAILGFSALDADVAHVVQLYGAGTLDDVWIPRAASEGWIIVTTDRGKQKSRGGKLPELCKRYRLTHVVFSAGANKMRAFQKQRAIVDHWEELVALTKEPPGSCYSLRCVGPSDRGRTVLVLVSRGEEIGPKTQQPLFDG